MNEKRCDYCKFCYKTAEGELFCRRFPPESQPGLAYAYFPQVKIMYWCGEWKQKEAKERE